MASKYSQKFPVPEAFGEILHDFAREILRDQPDNIIEYAALYFEAKQNNTPFIYESKYNVKPEKVQGSQFNPRPKKEVNAGAQKPVIAKPVLQETAAQQQKTTPQVRPPSGNKPAAADLRQVTSPISEQSNRSGITSHKDEKSIANEYINDLNYRALVEASGSDEPVEQDEEEDQEEEKPKSQTKVTDNVTVAEDKPKSQTRVSESKGSQRPVESRGSQRAESKGSQRAVESKASERVIESKGSQRRGESKESVRTTEEQKFVANEYINELNERALLEASGDDEEDQAK